MSAGERSTNPYPDFPPPDIVYLILDQCRCDKRTLRACSLVSKQWTPIARARLFETIAVHPTNVARNIPALSSWLDSNPELRRFVVHLKIQPVHINWETLNARRRIYPNFRLLALWDVLCKLDSLRELFLGSVRVLPPNPIARGQALARFRKIQLDSVVLCETRFSRTTTAMRGEGSFRSLSAFFAIFSSIHQLKLEALSFDVEAEPDEGLPPQVPMNLGSELSNDSRPYVGGIDFTHSSEDASLSEGLLPSIRVETLRSLQLKSYRFHAPVFQILIDGATCLQAVTIWVPSYASPVHSMMSLRQCKALTTLTLILDLGGSQISPGEIARLVQGWYLITSILQSVPSPNTLSTINLTIYGMISPLILALSNSLCLIPWENFGQALQYVSRGFSSGAGTSRERGSGSGVVLRVDVATAGWTSGLDVSETRRYFMKGLADVAKRHTVVFQ